MAHRPETPASGYPWLDPAPLSALEPLGILTGSTLTEE